MLSKEAECLKDTRQEINAFPLTCKVSAPCPLSNVGENCAQLIYSATVVIFEV